MKEKKQSQDWYIATTHYLTAGFAIPFIIGLVIGIPVAMIVGQNNAILLEIVMSIIWIISIWLGVMYAAGYVNKRYVIKDSDKIAKLATSYMVVLSGGFRLLILSKGVTTSTIIETVLFIIGVIVFYSFSKKYIKSDEVVMAQQ